MKVTIVTQLPPERDNKYRVLITLLRSDKPRYWNFLCHNCGSKIVEIQNMEVFAATDLWDTQDINNTAIGRHCKGENSKGFGCQYMYYFHIS